MIHSHDPWTHISVAASGQLSRLRVNPDTEFALFWFRDELDHPGLLVEISRDISISDLKEAKINIRDISVDVIELADMGIRAVTIRLHDEQNRDVFLKLCFDLVERVTTGGDDQNTFQIICNRLKKWQSLFSDRVMNLLSANEIQGLYAELYFIAELLAKGGIREDVLIQGWEGPEKGQHDFILNDMAVEIKSITANQRGKVRISSEDQLDTHLANLFMCIYFLSKAEKSHGECLNAIVNRINRTIRTKEVKNLFEIKLEAAHYIDIPDYDSPSFVVKDCYTYLVAENFPRISRKDLPEGIEEVSYDLVIASIDGFRTNRLEYLRK